MPDVSGVLEGSNTQCRCAAILEYHRHPRTQYVVCQKKGEAAYDAATDFSRVVQACRGISLCTSACDLQL